MGIARADRLAARLHEHAIGHGSRLTQTVVALGRTITVARTWPQQTHQQELARKRAGHLKTLCPLCNTKLTRLHASAYTLQRSTPLPQTGPAPLHWPK